MSFVYTISAVGTELILGLLVAVLLNQEIFLAKILRPIAAAAADDCSDYRYLDVRKLMMSPEFGVINYFLSFFGARDFPWASASGTAMFSGRVD